MASINTIKPLAPFNRRICEMLRDLYHSDEWTAQWGPIIKLIHEHYNNNTGDKSDLSMMYFIHRLMNMACLKMSLFKKESHEYNDAYMKLLCIESTYMHLRINIHVCTKCPPISGQLDLELLYSYIKTIYECQSLVSADSTDVNIVAFYERLRSIKCELYHS